MKLTGLALSLLLLPGSAAGQDFGSIFGGISRQTQRNAKVTGLRFRCVPEDCRVRPLESMVVQVLVDGEVPVKDGDPRKGRLQRAPGELRVTEEGGGWTSKPFKFQGQDPGGFVDSGGGFLSGVLGKVTSEYLVQDSFLYTAPATEGSYTLESDTEGVKGQVKVKVEASAPSQTKPEQYVLSAEDHGGEKYRNLAEHYAPMLAQETWWEPKADYPTRFDYDNDTLGDNNWENLAAGTSQAYVYYAAMETSTHWFLIYNVFHPRDYSDKCLAGSCHENDNEGLILTVQKDGTEFGKLLTMETLAHNNVYSFTNERTIGNGVHDIDGGIELYEGSHPVVFIESGGHGIYGTALSTHSRYSFANDRFASGTGVTFIYKGTAERPKHPNDRKVGYELLPILNHWWARAGENHGQKFFDEFMPYTPLGAGRPKCKLPLIGTTFWGRTESANKAKPFWGWHDNKTLKAGVLGVGQWGLDPAYAVSRNLRFPYSMPFSLDYLYNPYLGIGEETVTLAKSTGAKAGETVIQPGTATVGSPAPVSALVPTEGWMEVEATVDATVVFHLFEQDATPELISGQELSGLKVHSSGPLPVGGVQWKLDQKYGRGSAKIAEEPSEGNGQVLKVRVEDPRGGADRYVFRIDWKKR